MLTKIRDVITCCICTVRVQGMLVGFEESGDCFCGFRHWQNVSRDCFRAERRTFANLEVFRTRWRVEGDAVGENGGIFQRDEGYTCIHVNIGRGELPRAEICNFNSRVDFSPYL
jgi:hypothetical protein